MSLQYSYVQQNVHVFFLVCWCIAPSSNIEPTKPTQPRFTQQIRPPGKFGIWDIYKWGILPNKYTNQSTNQPTNQPTNQAINQSINQSINQYVCNYIENKHICIYIYICGIFICYIIPWFIYIYISIYKYIYIYVNVCDDKPWNLGIPYTLRDARKGLPRIQY